MNVLYITYDGAMDPLGHSQVIPYIKGLSGLGNKITLLSFEKTGMLKNVEARNALRKRLKEDNINWSILKYHKTPSLPATLYDIARGLFRAFVLVRREKIDFIHARSYIPAFIALILKKVQGREFIFDMRGLWADERIDGGIWPKGSWLYKASKYLEKLLLLNAASIVVLTQRVKGIIENFEYLKAKNPNIDVIPTSVDLEHFHIHGKDRSILNSLDVDGKFIMLYLGSLGTWYMLNEMIEFFKVFKERVENSLFLFVVNNGKGDIERAMKEKGMTQKDFSIRSSSYNDVPKWISVADASVLFIKPAFSKKASCATKFGESLACGIPVIINSDVGDMDDIVRSNRVGVVIDNFKSGSYRKEGEAFLDLIKDKDLQVRCRNTAQRLLSLEGGVKRFYRVYKNLRERAAK